MPSTAARPATIASPTTTQSVLDVDPRDTLPYLASDELEGRGVGTPGLDKAADFIASKFQAAGLKTLPGQADYFQPFDYTAATSPGSKCALNLNGQTLKLRDDFTPLSFSSQGTFSAPAVFAGYGISDPGDGYDDYAGVDVKGKVVIAMRYEPVNEAGKSRLIKTGDDSTWSQSATLGVKAKTAANHGAIALVLVTPPGAAPDVLLPFAASFMAGPASIPVLQLKAAAAEQALTAAGIGDLAKLKASIDTTFKPQSALLPKSAVTGTVEIDRVVARIKNVIGMIPGRGPHADEYVVVGAHYDHLGKGRLGHQFGPVGSIYYGADDNASGTVTVLDLASHFAKGPPPDRTLVFICFTAEEEGLIGSEHFVSHPPIPLEKMTAMLNLDMVGRLKDNQLFIGGAGTAADFDAILQAADAGSQLRLKSIGRGGMGPSDHMTFALKRVPVLFFFSGLHPDYHRPTDVASKINYQGIDEVVEFSQRVIDGLLKMPKEPYVAAADLDKTNIFGNGPGTEGPTRRVILGIIPVFSSEDSRVGVVIAGTTPGTPAQAAGLQAGDLIVQFENQKLENLMDLTQALANAKPGDKVKLKIMRGEKTLSVDVTLAERKG